VDTAIGKLLRKFVEKLAVTGNMQISGVAEVAELCNCNFGAQRYTFH